ncbi:MAG TPA: DUF3006 domain-containing protein [Patescibacteria group bacterium]|nr:DUF3006 domain-containing protein [Patescibacteria group bacterium]
MSEQEKMAGGNIIQCAVDRFEGGTAVLLTEAKEEILMPKKHLPEQTREGSVVAVKISRIEEIEKQREQTAKDILNELFGEHSNEKST